MRPTRTHGILALVLTALPVAAAERPLATAAGPVRVQVAGAADGPGGVRAAVEALAPDRLRLRAWSQRRDPEPASQNTVSLLPERMPWLHVERIAIRLGEEIGRSGRSVGGDLAADPGGWSWGWQRARDLRLRLCWRDAAAGDGPALPGGDAAADTLVFELCLRHGVGGGDEVTVHGSDFTAVYQVPKGGSASTARKDDANRLGLPTVLKGVAVGPELRIAFLAGPDGHWQIQLDRDGDGAADVTVGDTDAGCRPTAIRFADPRPVIDLVAATPERPEQVTATTLQLAVAPGPAWVAESRKAPRLAWVGEPPTASVVSPAPLRLQIETGCVPTAVDGAGAALPCEVTGERHATAVVPLDPARPATAVITAAGTPAATRTASVAWTPTRIAAGDPIRVLRGSSLLLEAPGASAITAGTTRLPARGPHRFDVLGDVALQAIGGDGATRTVTVTATDLPDPLPVPASGRALEVACDRPAADLAWSVEDGPAELAVLRTAGTRCRLAIKPGKAAAFTVVARDAAGQVLQRVRGVTVAVGLGGATAPARIVDPAATPGVDAQQFSIRLTPWVPGVRVQCIAIDTRCHFNRDLGMIEVVCGGGEATSGEAAMRLVDEGNGPVGAFDYAILSPTFDGSWAHKHAIVFPGDEPAPKKMPKGAAAPKSGSAPVPAPAPAPTGKPGASDF